MHAYHQNIEKHMMHTLFSVGEMEKKISAIVDMIGYQWKLPPFQRDFVWNTKSNIIDFVRSIYKDWPIGSIILWKPKEGEMPREERKFEVKIRQIGPKYFIPLYVLDGQQRLTTIKRIVDGEPFIFREQPYILHYNFKTKAFEFVKEGEKKKNSLPLCDILKGDPKEIYKEVDLEATKEFDIGLTIGDLKNNIYSRTVRYIHETEPMSRKDALELFVIVNTGGKQLKSVDLALGYLSLVWPNSRDKFKKFKEEVQKTNFNFDLHFFARCLAAVSLEKSITQDRVASFEAEKVEKDWEETEKGIRRTIDFLSSELMLRSNTFIKAENVLVPIVLIFSKRHHDVQKTNNLAYWFCVSYLNQRLSGQSTRVLDHDIKAIIEATDPIGALLKKENLEVKRKIVRKVSPTFFVGKKQHLKLLLCILARHNQTRDPISGYRISSIATSKDNKPNFDHIFPQSLLRNTDFRNEKDDIANQTLMAALSNKKKSDKRPEDFLPKIDKQIRTAHYIPLEEELYRLENYPLFLKRRRELISDAINDLLTRLFKGENDLNKHAKMVKKS